MVPKEIDIEDKVLLSLLKESDEDAYTQIYNRYWKKLLAIAFIHTKSKAESEEIVQEVMISLWDRRNEVEILSLNSYLATAIRFSVFKRIYQNRRRQEIDVQIQKSNYSLDVEEIDARFLKEYISSIVEQLPEKCKIVFKSSREDYKPNAQIAHEQGISEKTVEAHLTRAIKVLRVNLKKAGITLLSIAISCYL